jgi:hypothetical protein
MKNYIVYINGKEVKELLKAANHKAAEKKAQKKYGTTKNVYQVNGSILPQPQRNISVSYAEDIS